MTGPKTNEGLTKVDDHTGTRSVVRYSRVSASKARVVLNLIRGLDVHSADEVLRFAERDVAIVIRKCLASAVANAQHNDGQDPDELYVSACFADEGPTLKRFRPRARGRATRIRKRTCHITVIVSRLSDAELDMRRRQDDARPQAGRRGAAAAAASRRERVARSRQAAAAAQSGGTTPVEGADEELDTLAVAEAAELEGAAVTGEVEEALEDVTAVDADDVVADDVIADEADVAGDDDEEAAGAPKGATPAGEDA